MRRKQEEKQRQEEEKRKKEEQLRKREEEIRIIEEELRKKEEEIQQKELEVQKERERLTGEVEEKATGGCQALKSNSATERHCEEGKHAADVTDHAIKQPRHHKEHVISNAAGDVLANQKATTTPRKSKGNGAAGVACHEGVSGDTSVGAVQSIATSSNSKTVSNAPNAKVLVNGGAVPPTETIVPRPPSEKRQGLTFERSHSATKRATNSQACDVTATDAASVNGSTVSASVADNTRQSIQSQHALAPSRDWGEFLPDVIETAKLQWMTKQCKSLG